VAFLKLTIKLLCTQCNLTPLSHICIMHCYKSIPTSTTPSSFTQLIHTKTSRRGSTCRTINPQSTYIHKEYHSVCPLVGTPKGGGAHSPAGKGLGESQFWLLEKSLALCLLCVLKKWTAPNSHMSEISYAAVISAPLCLSYLYIVYLDLWRMHSAPVFADPDPAFSKNFGPGCEFGGSVWWIPTEDKNNLLWLSHNVLLPFLKQLSN
jgi:hypothetical protein